MAKEDLICFSKRTTAEQQEIAKAGGKASGEARRKKKATKDIIETFLTMPMKSGKVADIDGIKNFMALKGKNITGQEAIILKLVQKALNGDLKAIEMILSLTGEKPADKVSIDANIKNPMAELTTEELRKLIAQNDTV